ncbi:hypothetical protein CKQ90_34270, partial [Klebsiella pneumoniae]
NIARAQILLGDFEPAEMVLEELNEMRVRCVDERSQPQPAARSTSCTGNIARAQILLGDFEPAEMVLEELNEMRVRCVDE